MTHYSLYKFSVLFLLLVFIGIQPITAQNKTDDEFNIHSTILNEERTCFIHLPETYFEEGFEEHSYPVLILLDGKAFYKSTVGTVQFMSSTRNRNYFIPETIIVAIKNVDRERDFTVTKIKTKRVNTMGGGQNFLDFISTELIPLVDKNYRTDAHRTLVGHSLGGLLTLNAFMDPNSVFDAFLAIDPSVWWDATLMQTKVDNIDAACFQKPFYIATANLEERRYERNKKKHDKLVELLLLRSQNSTGLSHETFDNEDHRSVPLPAIYNGLRFLNQED